MVRKVAACTGLARSCFPLLGLAGREPCCPHKAWLATSQACPRDAQLATRLDSNDESEEEILCGIDQQTSNNDEASIDAASIDADFGVPAAPPDAVPDEPDVPLNSNSNDESEEEILCGIDQQTSNNDEASIDAASIDAGFGVLVAPLDAMTDEPDVPLNSSTLPTSVDSIVGGSSTAADSNDESEEEILCGIDQQTSNNDEASIDAASIDADFGVPAAPPDAVPDEPDVPLNSSTLPTSVDSIAGGSSTAGDSTQNFSEWQPRMRTLQELYERAACQVQYGGDGRSRCCRCNLAIGVTLECLRDIRDDIKCIQQMFAPSWKIETAPALHKAIDYIKRSHVFVSLQLIVRS
ncbi:hypothetical protein Dimus_001044 [Dionaea muscipula]